jgi:hypothetical protein
VEKNKTVENTTSEKTFYPGAFSRGIRLSEINAKFKDSLTPFIGTFQRLGLIKILYDPLVDDEPLVQITKKGKQQAIELLNLFQQIE